MRSILILQKDVIAKVGLDIEILIALAKCGLAPKPIYLKNTIRTWRNDELEAWAAEGCPPWPDEVAVEHGFTPTTGEQFQEVEAWWQSMGG